MAGPVEEASHVASGFIDALKAQPAVLALTVMLGGMLVFMFYALHAAGSFRDAMLKQQYEYQRTVTELLSRCVVPDRTKTWPLRRHVPIKVPSEARGDPERPPPVEDPPKPPPPR